MIKASNPRPMKSTGAATEASEVLQVETTQSRSNRYLELEP